MCHAIYYISDCACHSEVYFLEDIEFCPARPVSALDNDFLKALDCPFLTEECGGVMEGEECPECWEWDQMEPEE